MPYEVPSPDPQGEAHLFTAPQGGQRLDRTLADCLPQLSRAQIQRLIDEGRVLVDGLRVKAGQKLRGGESLLVRLPPPQDSTPQPEDIPLDVVYEDDDLVVIDKPAGLVVHPSLGNVSGTLVNALLYRYPQMVDMQGDEDSEGRLGIVHRLDKDTSGLLVVARHLDALRNLMAQFQARTVKKYYLALLDRRPKTSTGLIDAPIGRDPRERQKMSVLASGKPAQTEFELLEDRYAGGRALVRLHLLTGRTHQIRVHMAFIGCPVVGDTVYGLRKSSIPALKRHFLHAHSLSFDHPRTGERLSFQSPLPDDLQALLESLREVI
ncbi:MAG: RluA family pseudouridine synthase [Anaerolineae bacterium]|nr:RluA family pseudouridine synthase [Anaerolineae bacterium]MDW8171785.1 RluA family pseudouridine synthase [Anaerolineae bacterium]